MISALVVIVNELTAGFLYVVSIAQFLKIELFVFDGSKEPFDVHIVNGPSFSIHGYLDGSLGCNEVYVITRGKLTPLIGVDDLRSSVTLEGHF